MIQKIRYKLIAENCAPIVNDNGDAFDLVASQDITIKKPRVVTEDDEIKSIAFENQLVPLGIAIELPKGYKADLKPRSSTYKKWKVIQSNTPGLIDSSYCGDSDEWKLPVIALATSHIKAGDKVCQFEILLSQRATIWQKIKWLFTSGFEFVEVESLENTSRGGFGTTGSNIEEKKA